MAPYHPQNLRCCLRQTTIMISRHSAGRVGPMPDPWKRENASNALVVPTSCIPRSSTECLVGESGSAEENRKTRLLPGFPRSGCGGGRRLPARYDKYIRSRYNYGHEHNAVAFFH